MRSLSGILLSSLLAGQGATPVAIPSPGPVSLRLGPQKSQLTPQEMIRAMVKQEQTPKNQPGATVEVIGYDEEVAIKLLTWKAAEKVRLEFRPIDSRGNQELYTFMHQDQKSSSPVLIIPALAGGPASRADDKWLK